MAFSWMARAIFSDFREPAAGAAYEIAFDYLLRSGLMRDDFQAFAFLAEVLTAMVDEGHSNKILMANRAIAAYENSLAELARQQDQHTPEQGSGMELIHTMR